MPTRKRICVDQMLRRTVVIAVCVAVLGVSAEADAQQREDRRNQRAVQPGGRDAASQRQQEAIERQIERLREQQRQLMERRRAGDESVMQELTRIRQQIGQLEQRIGTLGRGENGGARGGDGGNDGSGAIRGELIDEQGVVELAFPGGGVALQEFINWVQRVLDINIISREGIRGQEVLLGEPLQFETDQLLDLLSALLARDGLALFKHDIGFYEIMPANNLPPVFREGELITTRVIPTPLIQPSAIMPRINEALGASADQVRIGALDDVGVLLVTGTPEMTETVSNVVERYVEERGKMELFSYAFENVSAEFARRRILSLYDRISQSGQSRPGQNQQAAAGSLSNLSEKLILDQGNTLIFRGRPDEWVLVKGLAERVDVVTGLRPKRYVVGQIAQQVANAGQSMGLGSIRRSAGGGVFRGGVSGRTGGAAQSDQDPALSSGFVLDAENGAVTYFGTESQHEVVGELVKNYREQTESNRVTVETYKLHHVPADEMSDLLNEILQDPSQQNQFQGSPFLPGSGRRTPAQQQQAQQPQDQQPAEPTTDGQAPSEGAAGAGGEGFITATADQVIITPNESRNLLVVRATPRNQREIEQIIERLDQRQPQVLIEAQIVSVTVEDDFDFSTDIQFSDGEFAFLSTFGVTSLADNLEATNTISGNPSGLTSAVFNSDFIPIAINALETIGDAKLISNPRVLVNDNEEASVQSEREEPFSSTTQGTATTVTSQGGTATAGTVLDVTPQISAGGYLVLEYSIELSAFEGQAQGGLQPPRQTENYDSIVTIPSDTTIIVGGFVSSRDTESVSQIPFIGDIPLIGDFFKSTSTQKEKRMIFVFITPKILDDPNFRDLRLATEGPLKDVELEGIVPDLMPAMIPINAALAAKQRTLGARTDESDLLLGGDGALFPPDEHDDVRDESSRDTDGGSDE